MSSLLLILQCIRRYDNVEESVSVVDTSMGSDSEGGIIHIRIPALRSLPDVNPCC